MNALCFQLITHKISNKSAKLFVFLRYYIILITWVYTVISTELFFKLLQNMTLSSTVKKITRSFISNFNVYLFIYLWLLMLNKCQDLVLEIERWKSLVIFTIINTIVDHLIIDNEHCKCRKGRIDLHEWYYAFGKITYSYSMLNNLIIKWLQHLNLTTYVILNYLIQSSINVQFLL